MFHFINKTEVVFVLVLPSKVETHSPFSVPGPAWHLRSPGRCRSARRRRTNSFIYILALR